MSLLAEFANLDLLNLIALLAVAFIGMPHGAMDGALAIHLGWMNRPAKAITFLLAYVGLAGIVIGLWILTPTIGFLLFLAISLFHFGRGDIVPRQKDHHVTEVLMRGGLVLSGISLFHRREVDEIFEALIGSDTSLIWLFLQSLGVVTVASIPFVLASKSTIERRFIALEIAVLLLIFAISPPLLGFAIYFCCIHSVRHFKHMGERLQSTLANITRTTVFFSLLTWAAGLVALTYQSSYVGLEPALLQVIFIGLAALTVPHMLLVDGMTRNTQKSPN